LSPGRHSDEVEAPTSEEAGVPETARYRVRLSTFEGPLDLLLHLIREHQVEILDIPVAFVTEKYLEYLDLMRVLNLDIAGEYLLMAATLVHMKSKMLLPRPVEAEEEEEEGDPRAALVRRLLEYQKYKDAAQQLAARQLLHTDVFPRAVAPEDAPHEDAPLSEVSVFQLLEAFAEVLKRVGGAANEVEVDRMSVTERIQELVDRLAHVERLEFRELFEGALDRQMVVVTFLALLEMARLRMLRLFQAELKGAIWITSTGVAAAGQPADDSFSYRSLEPNPVPSPRALSDEERAAIETLIDGDEDDEEEPPPEY
jgi:segregation and condensation protein A